MTAQGRTSLRPEPAAGVAVQEHLAAAEKCLAEAEKADAPAVERGQLHALIVMANAAAIALRPPRERTR